MRKNKDLIFKINEIKFYIELLDTLEILGKPLTNKGTLEKEASFIFSAILNSFYSTLEISRENKKDTLTSNFKKNYPIIYGQIKDGGLRNKTVHVSHVTIDLSGYVPSNNFIFKTTPKLVTEEKKKENKKTFNFSPSFYIKIDENYLKVSELCYKHLLELEGFIEKKHGIKA